VTGRTRSARFQPKWLRSAALLVFLLAISCAANAAKANAADKDPLRPPDTSSPRTTLQGFIGATDDAYSRMAGVLEAYGSSDRLYTSAEERRNQIAALRDAPKALQFLDLSGIPPVLKDTVAVERLLQLREILDRIDIPAFTDIPDAAALAQLPSKRWRLPNTEIDIALVDKGDRAGEYLVSAATIERLPEFFERVKDLPYKPGPGQQLADVYRSISHGGAATIYDAFVTSPIGLSYIIPPRWMLNLPSWAKARVIGIAAWQWLGLSLGCLIAGLIIFGGHRLARRGAPDDRDGLSARWRALPVPVAIVLVAGVFVPFVAALLRIGGGPRAVIAYTSTGAVYLSAAWLTMVIAVLLGEMIVASEHLTSRSLDSQLIRLGTRLLGLVAAIAILIQGGDELGFPAYSMLAGLGVGGLAVALAAQSTIANLIGSLLITMEKPFSVGHSVRIGGSEGTVEDVGFRSTRIRTADNSLVTIPSSSVVNTTVENLSVRTKRRQRFVVQVTYDTSREKLEELVARIKQLIVDHPLAEDSTCQVRFNAFGESSLDVLVMFHLQVADSATELSEREAVLLQIMDIVKELGLEFAFPTRTLQIGNADTGEKAPARPVQEASVVGFVSRT
jgi:MscS family membrane protein